MIIAIDGPAGSGKSTVAKQAALELGFAYLDTGAMYRAVTVRASQLGVAPTDAAGCTKIAACDPITFAYKPQEALPTQVFIAGIDVTQEIRSLQTDANVSQVSSIPGVREALTAQQRRLGYERDTVMEGRDIGTVVFPDAQLKMFLTADAKVRAARRVAQNVRRTSMQTEQVNPDDILSEIVRRDKEDSSREVAPLAAAQDAITLDTTDLSISQVVAKIAELAKQASKA